MDELTHECLQIGITRKLEPSDLIGVLPKLLILRGVPEHIKADNGPKLVAKAIPDWITAIGARTDQVEATSPRQNGHIESLRGRPCANAQS